MSISSLSSTLVSDLSSQWQNQWQNPLRQARQDSNSTGGATAASGQDQYVPSSQSPNYAEFVQQDYRQLAAALHTGNLSEAQSAFSNLEQALQSQGASLTVSSSSTTSGSSSSDPIANDLNSLVQALSSGNLNQAQSAFSQLNSDVKSAEQGASPQTQNPFQLSGRRAHGHHHHHHGGGGEQTSSTSSTDSTDSSTASGSTTEVYG